MTPATHQWAALGTYAQLVVDDDRVAAEACAIAKRLVADVDASCSRFRADSDLSRANARTGSWVRVDPLLVRAVEAALSAAHSTGGLVDPTLGRRLVDLGYDCDLHLVRMRRPADADGPGSDGSRRHPSAAASPAQSAYAAAAWRHVETDPQGWLKVPPGCALDLGATGKAFAADLVADRIVTTLGCSVIVSLGGDVACATVDDHRGWQVLVSDTAGGDLDAPGQVIVLTSGGLATSSTRHRRWEHRGAPVHHIIDPRTGQPATEAVVSATASAATCVDANAATTAAVILGPDAAGWLSQRGIPALLLHADGRADRVAGWPMLREAAAAC